MDIRKIMARAQEIQPWVVEKRRALHRIPEEGSGSSRRRRGSARRCANWAFRMRRSARGLWRRWKARCRARWWRCGRTWMRCPWRSRRAAPSVRSIPAGCTPVARRAYGHPAGGGRLLAEHRDELHGTVRLLFQPAEETDGGAEPMVKHGVMQGVDAVYGLHVQPYMNVGQIDSRPGCLNALHDEVNLTVHGVSSHAARPEQGVDAIVCAGQLISALQTAVSRSVSPLKPAVLTFGKIEGGVARNVLCDRVGLSGTLRTADPKVRETMKRRIREIAGGVGQAFGAQIDVEIRDGYCALMNDPNEVERVFRLGRSLLGAENVSRREEPSMGGEDFSYFVAEAPGAFYHLGLRVQPARAYAAQPRLPIG